MIARLVSGGQTGADQAGLAAAAYLGIPTGGYIPRGYRTEHGSEPWLCVYGIVETRTTDFTERTRLNVGLADITIWCGRPGTPGWHTTSVATSRQDKLFFTNPPESALRVLLAQDLSYTVNVAGNRESKFPGLFLRTYNQLLAAWVELL